MASISYAWSPEQKLPSHIFSVHFLREKGPFFVYIKGELSNILTKVNFHLEIVFINFVIISLFRKNFYTNSEYG